MPVVELEIPRLQKLVGKTNRKKIIQKIDDDLILNIKKLIIENKVKETILIQD